MRTPDLPMFNPAVHPPFDPSSEAAAGMLQFFERLQTHLQTHVDSMMHGYEALAHVVHICRGSKCDPVGIGSSRVVVSLKNERHGCAYAVKICWNRHDSHMNFEQTAFWLLTNDRTAGAMIPLHVLSAGGVLVTPWARPIVKGVDPTGTEYVDSGDGHNAGVAGIAMFDPELHEQIKLHKAWAPELAALAKELDHSAWSHDGGGPRADNTGIYNKRLVYLDASSDRISPGPEEMEAAVGWLREQLQHGDLRLDRERLRPLLLEWVR
jgi:hypothetical protein